MSVTIMKDRPNWVRESFYVRSEDNWEWMLVDVATAGAMIDLKINSSFGAMCFLWTHCGEDVDWRKWLLSTDFSYFMQKMFGRGCRCFSYDETRGAIVEAVLECTPSHRVDEVIEDFDWYTGDERDERAVMNWIQDNLDYVGHDDYWHLMQEVDRPDLVQFWEVLWRPFIEEAQK